MAVPFLVSAGACALWTEERGSSISRHDAKRPKRERTRFGRLLEYYRRERAWDLTDLQAALAATGYIVTTQAISRYEFGDRKPPVALIYWLSVCLELSQAEFQALVEAHLADQQRKFFTELRTVISSGGNGHGSTSDA